MHLPSCRRVKNLSFLTTQGWLWLKQLHVFLFSLFYFPSTLITNVFLNPAFAPFFSSFGNSRVPRFLLLPINGEAPNQTPAPQAPLLPPQLEVRPGLEHAAQISPFCFCAGGHHDGVILKNSRVLWILQHGTTSAHPYPLSHSVASTDSLTAGSAPLGFTPGQALQLMPALLGQLPLALPSHMIVSHSTHSESSLSCSPTTWPFREGLISFLSPWSLPKGFQSFAWSAPIYQVAFLLLSKNTIFPFFPLFKVIA